MSGLAFLFPGQGSQRPGMGVALRASDSAVLDAHLQRAQATSALPIARFSAEGPTDALKRTDVAQPALLAVSLALADVARSVGLRPAALAGHSLGEYTAAVVARALSPADGASLVAQRGRLMARAQAERSGTMAAVLGPAADVVDELCAQVGGCSTVRVANLNAPRQTVVSGDEAGVEQLVSLVASSGAGRAVRLPVGAAFHSELMEPVRRELERAAAALPWGDPETPLASNATGKLMRDRAAVRDAVVAQIAAPVRWVACVQALVQAGCRHFLELGPGNVLAGLVRQILPGADVASADSRPAIEAFAAARPHLVT